MGRRGRPGGPERAGEGGAGQGERRAPSHPDEQNSKSSRAAGVGRGGGASFPPAWHSQGLAGPDLVAFVDAEGPVL